MNPVGLHRLIWRLAEASRGGCVHSAAAGLQSAFRSAGVDRVAPKQPAISAIAGPVPIHVAGPRPRRLTHYRTYGSWKSVAGTDEIYAELFGRVGSFGNP